MSLIKNILDVVDADLCCGCGACVYVQPKLLEMFDVENKGLRPQKKLQNNFSSTNSNIDNSSENLSALSTALQVCPGVGLSHETRAAERNLNGSDYITELLPAWGPILEVWEGFATNPEVRFAGSSGGIATSLSMFALEQKKLSGVLHTTAHKDTPFKNQSVFSRTRDDLMAATGSRYSPASPCDGLGHIENSSDACVFVGKPCDVGAVYKTTQFNKNLAQKIDLSIAIFCAGTPSTNGTLELLKKMGVEDPRQVKALRYRGNGWPGATSVHMVAGKKTELSYEESWGEVLSKHVQWRCKVCADHSGEFADISVGDPWYRPIEKNEAGQSLILIRSERGRAFFAEAMKAGYIQAARCSPKLLPASQPNLLLARAKVWGRILACRVVGIPAPVFVGMPQFRFWWTCLSLREKLASIFGTWKRLLRKTVK